MVTYNPYLTIMWTAATSLNSDLFNECYGTTFIVLSHLV